MNLYGEGAEDVFALLARVGLWVGERLRAFGFRGPAGIDNMVFRGVSGDGEERLFVKPIVEINPRLTMGRVALELGKHLQPGAVGVWAHVSLETLRALGHATPSAYLSSLQARLPLILTRGEAPLARSPVQPLVPPLIRQGVVATQDPAKTRGVLSVLMAAKSLDDLPLAELGCKVGM